jgi:hypothetical protein
VDPVSFALAVMPAGAPAPRRSLPGRDDPAVAPFLVHPARPPRGPRAATGVPTLDALLDGGFPAGQISELVGPRTSGRTRVLLGTLAAATGRGALAALVDATDGLDPRSAQALGLPLGRLLWVRGDGRSRTAWHAADILLRGGGFAVVAVDLGDAPPWTLAGTPPAVFVRLQRAVERTGTVLLLAGPRRVAGSLAAVAVALGRRGVAWAPGGPGLLAALEVEARLLRSRTRAPGAGVALGWSLLGAEPRPSGAGHRGSHGALPVPGRARRGPGRA